MSATAVAPAPTVSPKRQAILAAASELFLAEGYAAVSMDAVARRAGVSKATLYAHLASKEALFGAVVEARCAAMAEGLDIAAQHELPLRDALAALGRYLLDFVLSPPVIGIFRVALAEGVRFPDLARAFHEAGPMLTRARVTAWVTEEQRRGRLRSDADPALIAEHCNALMRGSLLMRVMLGIGPAPGPAEIGAAADAAAEAVLRAYGA